MTVPAALKARTAWLFEMNPVPYIQLRVFEDTTWTYKACFLLSGRALSAPDSQITSQLHSSFPKKVNLQQTSEELIRLTN